MPYKLTSQSPLSMSLTSPRYTHCCQLHSLHLPSFATQEHCFTIFFPLLLPFSLSVFASVSLALSLPPSLFVCTMLLSSRLTLIPIGIIIVVAAFKWLRTWIQNRAFAASRGCQPPVRLSRLRNIIQQIKAMRAHTWLDMWCHRYSTVGTTFESATVSIEPIIFTNDPENIKTILATDFKTFELGDRRRRLMGPLLGPGIFSNDGPAWEHSRVSQEEYRMIESQGSADDSFLQALMRPNFTKMQISDLSTFESHFQNLLTALPPANPHSGLVEVDLQPLFFCMTLDSASEVLLGRAMSFLSQLDPPESASLRFLDAFDYAQIKIHRRSVLDRGWMKPFGLVYFLLKGKKKDKFEKACDTVHSILDEMIAEFLRSYYQTPFSKHDKDKDVDRNKKYVFLDEMAKTTLDPLELRSEILNVLVAGRDTTGSLLSNAFFVLARRPDIWARVRAEVDETFEGRLPDYTTLRNMKQVRNLLNECKCSPFPLSCSYVLG